MAASARSRSTSRAPWTPSRRAPAGADECFGFGAMMLHTRTSDNLSSANLVDFVEPVSVPKLTNCAPRAREVVARDDGTTVGTFADRRYRRRLPEAPTTDHALQYRIEVTNPSEFPFPQAGERHRFDRSGHCDDPPVPGSYPRGAQPGRDVGLHVRARAGPLTSGPHRQRGQGLGGPGWPAMPPLSKEIGVGDRPGVGEGHRPRDPRSRRQSPVTKGRGGRSAVAFVVKAENTGNDPL